MHRETAAPPDRSRRQIVMTIDDAEVRLRDLNALEGFDRWQLKVYPNSQYQVLELDANGKVCWRSFRKENIRVVVGWAAQQTNKRKSMQAQPSQS